MIDVSHSHKSTLGLYTHGLANEKHGKRTWMT